MSFRCITAKTYQNHCDKNCEHCCDLVIKTLVSQRVHCEKSTNNHTPSQASSDITTYTLTPTPALRATESQVDEKITDYDCTWNAKQQTCEECAPKVDSFVFQRSPS
eukprot:Lankesteria_metandrocarpae@DN7404_c0_g1_i1.p1